MLADVTRWERVEIDLLRLLAAGLSLAVPVAIGDAAANLGAGMAAALGALIVSGSGHAGSLRARLVDLVTSTLAGVAGIFIGMVCDRADPARSVVPVVAAVVVALVGTLRPAVAKAAGLFLVFLIVGATLSSALVSPPRVIGYVVLGAALGGFLTLVAFGVAHHVLGRRAVSVGATRRSWAADLTAWRTRLGQPVGWLYALRLGSCMLTAELLVHLLREPHSYWILLTVVLVVQRDPVGGLARTLQRGIGTALGVLVGALLLNAIPMWATVCVLGLIGAARIHLKVANYTAYALVMTPLIAVLSGLGHNLSAALLRERLVDTVIGCSISLVVGYAVWHRWNTRAG